MVPRFGPLSNDQVDAQFDGLAVLTSLISLRMDSPDNGPTAREPNSPACIPRTTSSVNLSFEGLDLFAQNRISQ